MKIAINPKPCGPLGTASKVIIYVHGFNVLADNCNVEVSFFSDTDKQLGDVMLIMDGTTYQNWSDDNTYVKTWVFNQLGLQDRQ